jgi:hypothetical protein
MRRIPLPKFHEALLDEEWYKAEFEQKVKTAESRKNPFVTQYLRAGMREGIFSDMAGALGRIHDVVVEAAKPNMIARDIIDVRTTAEALERFPRAEKSVAYVSSKAKQCASMGNATTGSTSTSTWSLKTGLNGPKSLPKTPNGTS